MNFSRHFYAVAGIIVVLSAASLGAGGKTAARPQPMPVVVTNTIANPVNTKAVGTTAVSGSVNVAGSVSINNSAPIDVNEAFSNRTPVNVTAELAVDPGSYGGHIPVYTVPAGKMLILQSEWLDARFFAGQYIESVSLDLEGAGTLMCLSYEDRGNIGPYHVYNGNTYATCYLPAGTTINLNGVRTASAEDCVFDVGISGYLVPMPVAGP